MEKGGVKQREIGEGGGEGGKYVGEDGEAGNGDTGQRDKRKIEGAKYNRYKWVKEEKIPEYLEKGKKKENGRRL